MIDYNRFLFKFTGKEEDIEVGLTYFGARYYQAHLGRWLSADPLTIHGLGSDLNPYAYVGGRVMTHVHPAGFCGHYSGPGGNPDTHVEADMGTCQGEAEAVSAGQAQARGERSSRA